MANDVKRDLPDLAYVSAGAVSTLDIPRDSVLKSLSFTLTLDMTTAAAMVAATGASRRGVHAAIRRLEVVADGALTLHSMEPYRLYRINSLYSGNWYPADALAFPAAGASNELKAFNKIQFALPFANNRNLTLLNAAALSSLQLRVTWGAMADLAQTPSDTVIDTTSILHTTTHEIVGLDPRSSFSAHKMTEITRDITAASTEFQIDLPRSNVVRGLFFEAHNVPGGSVRNPIDTILNAIRVESSELNRGIFVHRRMRVVEDNAVADAFGYNPRADAMALYGLSDLSDIGLTPTTGIDLLGLYPVEFMEDKEVSSAIRTQAFSSFQAILDVSATGTTPQVTVVTAEIIPAAPPR